MRRKMCLATMSVVFGCCPVASAAITVLGTNGNPVDPEHITITYDPKSNGYTIELLELYAPGGETVYDIHGDGGEIIDRIDIAVPCWQAPDGTCIPAGSPVYVNVFSDGPLGIKTIKEIEQTGDAEVYLLEVTATEDVGPISAQVIGWITAGRDVTGDIIASTDNPIFGVYIIWAERDVLGDIRAEQGRVGLVRAFRNIGTAAAPSIIRGKYYVNGVAASEDMYAHIFAHADDGQAFMNVFQANRFWGSLNVDYIVPDMWVPDAPGRIQIYSEMHADIIINGGFDNPDQWIELPADGFEGSIVINAENRPGESWNAPVHIGPVGAPGTIVIPGPGYDIPSSLLGGGSIGNVPFDLHRESSSPANGDTLVVAPDSPVTLLLEHYGPVRIGGIAPLTFERRPTGSTGPYLPLPPVQFTVGEDPSRDAVITVSAPANAVGFEPGFEYRIHATAELLCDVANPVGVQWSEPYTLIVEPEGSCDGDIDGNGAVDVLDLLAMLDLWGAATNGPADIDGNGIVGVRDLLALLAVWGPCPAP